MERRFPGFGPDREPEPTEAGPALDAPPTPGIEARQALLIGNAAYGQAALRNPRRDIRLVGAALVQLGFTVTRVDDADLATLRRAIAGFAEALGRTDPDTIAVFYFAGHAVQLDGINYLVPVDADPALPGAVLDRALALDEVVQSLSASGRRANILVLDACRDGALADTIPNRRGFTGGLAALSLPPAGMLVAYSTAAGRAADDGAGANSPYATALVETLPGLLEPGRRVHDIFVETAEKVRAATGGRQSPALFLQGGLPALTLSPEDAQRRTRYNPWGPARARRVALLTGGGVLAVLLLAFAGLVWTAMAPIDQRTLLSRVGLADPPGAGLSCAAPLPGAGVDRYGLRAADWCRLMPQDVYRAARDGSDGLPAAIAVGVAEGDPKALFLQAAAVAARFPDLLAGDEGSLTDDVAFNLDRAARSGLPVAALFWDELAHRHLLPPRLELLHPAAADGHLPSQAILAIEDVEAGRIETGIAALEALQAQDPTGFAAYLLSLALGGAVSPQAPVDLPRSRDLVREAARKGNLAAIDRVLLLESRGILTLAADEEAAMMQRLFEVGREEGYWWRFDRLRATGTAQDDTAARALLAEMIEMFPGSDAAYQFADFASRGIGGPVSAADLSRALDRAISAQSPYARTLRGELRMGLRPGPDHLPRLPIDPAGALADLQAAWELTADPQALLLLARYHLLGVGGARDVGAAKAALRIALDDPDGVSSAVVNLAASVDLTERLAGNRSAADIAVGDPQAPVTVTVFLDSDCGDCSAATERLAAILPWLQATYLRHGFARLDLRPVAMDGGVTPALARLACPGGTDPEAAIRRLFGPTGAADQSSCVDPALLERPNADRLSLLRSAVFADSAAIAPDRLPGIAFGQSSLPPDQTLPVVVVNGWVLSPLAQDTLEVTIYHQLSPAAQVRAREMGARTCQGAADERLLQRLTDTGPAPADALPPRRIALPPAAAAPKTGWAAATGIFCAGP